MYFNIASAPCSFGINETTNWQEYSNLTFEEFLHITKDQGYDSFELGDNGFYPENALKIKELIDKYNMRCNGIFVSFPLLANTEKLKEQQIVGYKYLHKVCQILQKLATNSYVPYIIFSDSIHDTDRIDNTGNKYNKSYSKDDLYLVLKELNNIQTTVKSYGLRLLYHQHAGTFFESFNELLIILFKTEINIVLDTGHFIYGLMHKYKNIDMINQIIYRFIDKHHKRIELIHFKNVNHNIFHKYLEKSCKNKYNRLLQEGIFTNLNTEYGVLNINLILPLIIKYRWDIVIEQDIIDKYMLKKAEIISKSNITYLNSNLNYQLKKKQNISKL